MKKRYILIIILFNTYLSYGQGVDLFIKDVGIIIKGGVCLQGDFFDESNGGLTVVGDLCFKNLSENEFVFSSRSDYAKTQLCFKGSANSYLEADNVSFMSLELNMPDSDLYLSGDLSLSNSLSLFSGRVLHGSYEGEVSLTNSSESSIVFNNVKNNTSYLAVKLNRAVVPGNEYYYPMGDEKAYHPFIISDIDVENNIKLSYSPTLDEEWADATGNNDFVFPTSGAWLVENNGFETSFKTSLSIVDDAGLELDEKHALFYVSDPPIYSANSVVDRDVKFENSYMRSGLRNGAGLYALVESKFGVTPEGDDINLVNTIVVNNTFPSCFIIPEMSKYKRIEFKVYDSWGRVVFSSKEYANDFNCKNYPNGTYYYHMIAILLDGKEIVKDDIIEVVREND